MCLFFRLKRRSRRYLLDPDLVGEWAAAAADGGCGEAAAYSRSADHQLLIDAIEQEVEFDDHVDTVVCIDDSQDDRRLSDGSEPPPPAKDDIRQQKSRIADRYRQTP